MDWRNSHSCIGKYASVWLSQIWGKRFYWVKEPVLFDGRARWSCQAALKSHEIDQNRPEFLSTNFPLTIFPQKILRINFNSDYWQKALQFPHRISYASLDYLFLGNARKFLPKSQNILCFFPISKISLKKLYSEGTEEKSDGVSDTGRSPFFLYGKKEGGISIFNLLAGKKVVL